MGCLAGPRGRSWQHATGERPGKGVEAQAAGARKGEQGAGLSAV